MPVFMVTGTVPYHLPDNLSQYRIPDYDGICFRVYGLSTGWDAFVAQTSMAQYRASLFQMIVFLSSDGGRHYPDKKIGYSTNFDHQIQYQITIENVVISSSEIDIRKVTEHSYGCKKESVP